jgi:hypothetical protein
MDEVPRVPGLSTLLDGVNAGVTFSGTHDSSIGWYSVATPAVSYTFSPHYAADASLSIYPYRLVETQVTGPQQAESLTAKLGDLGDTFIGLHASFNPHSFRTTTTASFTLPTGNQSDGLGAGKVTFDFSDHLERYFGQTGLLLDLGAGDSSALFNRLVTNNYTSVGALAHFQGGAIVWLPRGIYLESVAYEQLPFGQQTLYSDTGPPGSPAGAVVTGTNVGEDNGVTTALGIPLTPHIKLSAYYSRSFQQHLDTVSAGVTYVLRGTTVKRGLSMIDRALLEAERGNP